MIDGKETPQRLSCVITFHNEGYLAHTTLLSVEKCRDYFNTRIPTHPVEIVFVLDKTDNLTEKIVNESSCLKSWDKVLKVKYGDLSKSRNYGVSNASGDIISILDGDDYYSENYLYENYINCVKNPSAVSHPQVIQSFGASNEYFIIKSSDSLDDSIWYSTHPYNSSVTASRKIFEQVPYQPLEDCYAYEDWLWNLEVLSLGYKHIPAEKTIRFYRRKKNGQLQQQRNQARLIYPSSFFDKETYEKLQKTD